MLTETRQISNLRSQDVSKEILSDLVRKNVAEFSDKFFHFQYATREMCKVALIHSIPIPDEEKTLSWIFTFILLCDASKGFMKALKAFS